MGFGPALASLLLRSGMLKGDFFHSHGQASGHRLTLQRPLGPSRLAARYREAAPEVSEPTKEVAKLDPAVAIEEVREPLAQTPVRPKAEGPKVHIGFRLAADVVESVRGSGPGYNRRVEEALRAAGFGAKANKRPRNLKPGAPARAS